jgi:hypothetical protein
MVPEYLKLGTDVTSKGRHIGLRRLRRGGLVGIPLLKLLF